ncbi:MAG: hypothetical protein K6G30_03850 [Acetatifactor sp.]|nr:hypothetical protein [Acetatifactor sp.]
MEKNSALMLYRCLKPLWFNKLTRLKELGKDYEAIHEFLNKTEYYLTAPIDFGAWMG